MSVHAQLSSDRREVHLAIEGRFDFSLNREFRAACADLDPSKRCVVDLAGASYLDCSALGMLLLLGDLARDVRIVRCSADVRKVLELVDLHRRFDIS